MEHKHKLLATTSCQAKGACSERIGDRFSNLPEGVAHYILSSLSISDLTRFSTVSKKCRELYLSVPSLNFDEFNNWDKSAYGKQLKLISYLDRFLVCRRYNKIQSFRIRWSISCAKASANYNEIYRVATWFHLAVKSNVEVLDIELRIPVAMTLELPPCIFLCGSLRSLSVHCNKFLTAPSLACSTNLQYLKLKNVTIDEEFCKWISSSCKYMKELHLEQVKVETITIESTSLVSFSFLYSSYSGLRHLNISCEKLEEIHIEWRFDSPSSRSLKVFAPTLNCLKWSGNSLKHQNLGKLMCLEKAEIFLDDEEENNNFSNIPDVLCSLCRVKVLILSGETTKALSKPGSKQARFDYVSYLGMHIESLDDDLIPAVVSLLRGMPNLNTLFIKSEPPLFVQKTKECGFNMAFWKSQKLGFIDKLEEVRIELSNGNNELELARYMLESAKNLKEMVILHSPQQSVLIREVNESQMNSAARVVFQEKQRKKILV